MCFGGCLVFHFSCKLKSFGASNITAQTDATLSNVLPCGRKVPNLSSPVKGICFSHNVFVSYQVWLKVTQQPICFELTRSQDRGQPARRVVSVFMLCVKEQIYCFGRPSANISILWKTESFQGIIWQRAVVWPNTKYDTSSWLAYPFEPLRPFVTDLCLSDLTGYQHHM